MKFSKAKTGRVFVIRLEDGEIIHEKLEEFARSEKITCASINVLGGVDKGSKLIVGPEKGREKPVSPVEIMLDDVHEATGTGTIFPDESGMSVLHLHIACGRGNKSITGCVRNGVKVWHVLEVIMTELVQCKSARILDEATGFELLIP